jgi:hypothetical protein
VADGRGDWQRWYKQGMMTSYCGETFVAEGAPAAAPAPVRLTVVERELPAWMERLQAGLSASGQACDQNLGHLEEQILQQTQGLARQALEEAAQAKADATPPRCPYCGGPLTRLTHGHARTFQSRFGAITMRRTRGWCRRCQKWRFPADAALGLEETAGYSPSVQEMAALAASKLPIAEASAVLERLSGVKLPPATLDREARRQGERAQRQREALDRQMATPEGRAQQVRELQLELPLEPFTLVIELDAWNVRERDDWGQSAQRRAAGQEPARWHWVYGGTCFRLSQRVQTAGGRPLILSRGTVMTRGGVDALRDQLWAEASRHGLGRAAEVLVVADGAVWIWNLAHDRFPQARQRLDLYHAKQHLWAVAEALHGTGTAAARQWVAPLLRHLDRGRGVQVITQLQRTLRRLRQARRRAAVQTELNYFESHRGRLDYAAGQRRGEPLGSGAIESTCRQYQCRFKRPGQFWTTAGDEALMCLETFWRNGRWHRLFPHVGHFDPSKN